MISEDPWQKNYKPEKAASSEVCNFYKAASLHNDPGRFLERLKKDKMLRKKVTVHGFKVPFLSPDCIWDANLREKRQLRQA